MDPKPNRNLSEISHLFLSSLRDRQTGGAPRPQRRPPQPQPQPQQDEMSIDMTPEEFARMHGAGAGNGGEGLQAPMAMPEARAPGAFEPAAVGAMSDIESEPVLSQRVPPVTAVIASHLSGQAMDRVRQYGRHLAAGGQRVGLIEVDAGEFVVICFEAQQPGTVDAEDSAQPPIQRFDARQVSQAIEELNWDLDRWLLVLPNTRTPEARQLLELTGHWVLLAMADRDGVVACYRTIKGLAEEPHPALSLAILGAGSDAEAAKISQKLVSVCGEFLSCAVEVEPAVGNGDGVAEHMAICCDLAGGAESGGQQWQLVSSLLSRASKDRPQVTTTAKPATPPAPIAPAMNVREVAAVEPARSPMNAEEAVESVEELTRRLVEDVVMPPVQAMKTAAATVAQAAQTVSPNQNVSKPAPAREPVTAVEFGPAAATQSPAPTPVPTPAPAPVSPMAMPAAAAASHDEAGVAEVIDLTDFGGISGSGILSAVLRQGGSDLAECPVRPPMCAEARLAVSRDRRLVLLAAARQGLGDLRAIGQAYHWMMENRSLIAMAMPQFAIDAHQPPQLRLLVDQADASAQLLQPMLESRNVTVQTYRRLRWGPKTGLLLEAA